MARIKKKGQAGQAKNFVTRTQAVRKLQVSLPDFRRLCIFKGVYPREPRNKKKASKTSGPNATFYYTKDIQYLLHEPLLAKFRDHKAVSKKIARSLGKGEVGDAARLDRVHNKKLSLDHIVKERYPTFVDALRDLDDALSLLFLFAGLPSTSTVPRKTISLCRKLCHEFQHYLIKSHTLRKSFISIKGIYYQATIQGQDILWLVPHNFVQKVTGDVDFRIMATFVEFYTTLLGFVNYRLYTTLGLVYPPKIDNKADEEGGELDALKLESRGLGGAPTNKKLTTNGPVEEVITEAEIDPEAQKRVDELSKPQIITPETAKAGSHPLESTDQDTSETIDAFNAPATGGDVLLQPSTNTTAAGLLFSKMTFYLSRETPRQPLELLLRAFGGKRIGWDAALGSGAFTNDELDPSITHQVVDRPPAVPDTREDNQDLVHDESAEERPKTFQYGFRVPGRLYVQPQWVWDCVNAGQTLRADLYAPGALLPPHLSPFVKPRQGEYDPTKSLAEQEREGEVEEFEEAEQEAAALEQDEYGATSDSDETGNEKSAYINEHNVNDEPNETGMQVASSGSEDVDQEENGEVSDEVDFSSNEDAEYDTDKTAHNAHQAELEAEAKGMTLSDIRVGLSKDNPQKQENSQIRRRAERKRRAEEEERERRMGMMPRKKKKLYEKMQYGLKRDNEQAQKLRTKKRRLQKEENT